MRYQVKPIAGPNLEDVATVRLTVKMDNVAEFEDLEKAVECAKNHAWDYHYGVVIVDVEEGVMYTGIEVKHLM